MNLKNLVEGSFIADLLHDVRRQLTADIHEELEKLEERIAKLENGNTSVAHKDEPAGENNEKSGKKVKVTKAKGGRRRKEPVPCSVEGCDKPSRCKGLCLYHYQKMRAQIKSTQDAAQQDAQDSAESKQERLEQIKPIIRRNSEVSEAVNTSNEPVVENNSANDEFTHPGLRPIV